MAGLEINHVDCFFFCKVCLLTVGLFTVNSSVLTTSEPSSSYYLDSRKTYLPFVVEVLAPNVIILV